MKLIAIFASAAYFFSLVGFDTFPSQDSKVHAQSLQTIKITRVKNEGGWNIPDLKNLKTITSRTRFYFSKSPLLPSYIVIFAPQQEVKIFPNYFVILDDNKTLQVKTQEMAIEEVRQFDVDHHIFCYAIQAVGIVSMRDEFKGYGGRFGVFYYDEDGDGTFETMEYGLHTYPHIPEWVINKYESSKPKMK